eukprot:TRINITY_DN260_c0_g1_i1.p1 TRINITY_DN260_c0_g1~~TRINITY_DN260_c0_g1_i1.p1  ORF type:complete len:182 (-),score=33.23 TRINITY_DN260_c0_g1_i1:97-642(-)
MLKQVLTFLRSSYIAQKSSAYLPTICENYTATVLINDKPCSVSLWDTAGQEEYDRIRPLSYADATVFVMCFSVASEMSFHNLSMKWYPEISHHCPQAKIIVVGTKADVRDDKEMRKNVKGRIIPEDEGQHFAQIINACKYIECSSVSMEGIKDVFNTAIMCGIPEKQKSKKIKRKKGCALL